MLRFRRPPSRSSSGKDSRSTSKMEPDLEQAPAAVISQLSPRSVTSSPLTSSHGEDIRRVPDFEQQQKPVPMSSGRIQAVHQISLKNRGRSLSTSRATVRKAESMKIVGRDERQNRSRDVVDPSTLRRSRSTQRPTQMSEPTLSIDSSEQSGEKKRKSKMEKIRQLQAKNELYKEEFKRVQKDRKKLKKEIEAKNLEVASLIKEIDSHIAETSVLKSKLSEALMQIDKNSAGNQMDKSTVANLQKELKKTKDELSVALRRVSSLKDDMSDLREYVRRKDEQIESLTFEVSAQQNQVVALEEDNKKLKQTGNRSQKKDKVVDELVEENERLQGELGKTLDRASTMVKEREDAISDLLKENDEMKKLLSIRERAPEITQEQLEELREELEAANASLEEAQDRNVMLEEEIEAWLSRGTEMESMLDQLNNDIEAWKQKAEAAQESLSVVEAQAVDAKAEADAAKQALEKADAQHKAEIAELETKHSTALLEAEAKAYLNGLDKTPAEDKTSAEAQQAMLLQAVVDSQNKPTKQGHGQGGWLGFLQQKMSEDEESLDENQKRIKELEARNASQEEEIKTLKSELVRLRSAHNEASYMSKKKIERLTEENEAYAAKTVALQIELEDARSKSSAS